MTHVPEIILKSAIMVWLLDRLYRKKREDSGICNRHRKKTTTSYLINQKFAEQYENRYIIYREFVYKCCHGYEDVAWYFFERHYNLAFCEQYLLDKTNDNDENWNLSIGIRLLYSNNYSLIRGLFSMLKNRKEDSRIVIVGSVENKLRSVDKEIKAIMRRRREFENDIRNSAGQNEKLLEEYLKKYEQDIHKKEQEKSRLREEFYKQKTENILETLGRYIKYLEDNVNDMRDQLVSTGISDMALDKYIVESYILKNDLHFKKQADAFNTIYKKFKQDRKNLKLENFERKKFEESLLMEVEEMELL